MKLLSLFSLLINILTLSGCNLYRPSYPYQNECKAWVGEVNPNTYRGMTASQAMELLPDPQERYNYYICINSFMHPMTQKEDIFFPDADQSAKIAGRNLINLEKINEIFLTVEIIYAIHTNGKYNVVSDKQLMEAIMESKKKIKNPTHKKNLEKLIARMQAHSFEN